MRLTKTQKATIKNWQKELPGGVWVLDPVLLRNYGTKLLYKGDISGPYIECTAKGGLAIGIYEHAYGGITNGIFTSFLRLDLTSSEADDMIHKLVQ